MPCRTDTAAQLHLFAMMTCMLAAGCGRIGFASHAPSDGAPVDAWACEGSACMDAGDAGFVDGSMCEAAACADARTDPPSDAASCDGGGCADASDAAPVGDGAPCDGPGCAEGGAPDGGPPLNLDPKSNNCLVAETGPFVEVGQLSFGATTYGIWPHGDYVLAATTTGGLRSLTFDGTTFREVDRNPDTGWTEALWSSGEDVYVSAPGTGLWVFDVAADGRLVELASDLVTVQESRRVWGGDGNLLFVPNAMEGLFAYHFDGSSLSQVGSPAASISFSQAAYSEAGTVFLADNTVLRALTFDGSTFTEITSAPAAGASRIWPYLGMLLVGTHDGVMAFRFEANELTEVATAPTADRVREVWSDGVHVFAVAQSAGIYAFRWVDGGFSELDHVPTATRSLGIVGDGQYIYVGDGDAGIRAFAGFACQALGST